MAKQKKGKGPVQVEPAQDEREARVMEAARRAYRLAKEKLHEARDPAASKAAYEAVWAASDEVGTAIVESVEEEEAEEDPDVYVDADGTRWKAVTEDARTYHTLRGPIRVKRKRHRAVRNGPTRCFFEERRGVMSRSTMPDLGEALLRTYADVPGDEAAKLLTTLTRHPISPSRIKRFVVDESTAMLAQEKEFFDAVLVEQAMPEEVETLVISVDALSLRLREEGWKQATVGTVTMLDAEGEPVRRGSGTHTIRIAEMPEAGKATIMERVEREVRAFVAQRPDVALEVVIDGAGDLRTHLLERFPEARHLTDFFHVVEHLAEALRLLFPSDDARRAEERARWCHKLKHKQGTPFRLWRWLRDEMKREEDPVSSWARREIEKHAEYIYNQREWMKYPQAVEAKARSAAAPSRLPAKRSSRSGSRSRGRRGRARAPGASSTSARSFSRTDSITRSSSGRPPATRPDQLVSCTPNACHTRRQNSARPRGGRRTQRHSRFACDRVTCAGHESSQSGSARGAGTPSSVR